ncbi:hypothetical protein [Burkholderia pseudomallei]|uniref:hypothetical protein n=1 Tax=Burkholderia pseudomallei TaxID=28450 RepID=UPI001F1B7F1B|nr:hypothetical protein [Burkholderia pseudomallei]
MDGMTSRQRNACVAQSPFPACVQAFRRPSARGRCSFYTARRGSTAQEVRAAGRFDRTAPAVSAPPFSSAVSCRRAAVPPRRRAARRGARAVGRLPALAGDARRGFRAGSDGVAPSARALAADHAEMRRVAGAKERRVTKAASMAIAAASRMREARRLPAGRCAGRRLTDNRR